MTKHLAIQAANLVATVRQGREKLHYLNPVPIDEIAERWIGKYEIGRLGALSDLKKNLEKERAMTSKFVYVTYIRTTPAEL